MSRRKFQSHCEKMRFEALKDGNHSQAYLAWSEHAANCPECHASLHVFELLSLQDDNVDLSLDENDTAKLVDVARKRFQEAPRRKLFPMLCRLSWKAAVVFCVVALISHYVSIEWLLAKGVGFISNLRPQVQAVANAEEAGNGCYFIPLGNGSEELERAMLSSTSPSEAVCLPEVIPCQGMDSAIRDMRTRVMDRYKELTDLIDSDLTSY